MNDTIAELKEVRLVPEPKRLRSSSDTTEAIRFALIAIFTITMR